MRRFSTSLTAATWHCVPVLASHVRSMDEKRQLAIKRQRENHQAFGRWRSAAFSVGDSFSWHSESSGERENRSEGSLIKIRGFPHIELQPLEL